MKLNKFMCPHCRQEWFDSCAYGTCDRCGSFFYLFETLPQEFSRARYYINGVPREQWLSAGTGINTTGWKP